MAEDSSTAAENNNALVEGPRAQRLRQVLDRCLTQTVKSCSYERMAQCFPTLAMEGPEQLRSAHGQVTTFLRSQVEREFEEILKERGTAKKLNDLDQFIEKAKERKTSGDPESVLPTSRSPDDILRAHVLPVKKQELAFLKAKLARIQASNDNLAAEVDKQRAGITETTQRMRKAFEELDQAVQTSLQIPVQEMHAHMEEIVQEKIEA
ncbi:hypothetical protein YB2330_002290 [Saitoella coloradoensis]